MNKRYSDKKLEWIPDSLGEAFSNGRRWNLLVDGQYSGRIVKYGLSIDSSISVGWNYGAGPNTKKANVNSCQGAALELLESLKTAEPVIIEGDMWGRKN